MYGYFSEDSEVTLTQSVEWYQSIAEQGDSDSQYIMGNIYRYGIEIEKDPPSSSWWIMRAANNGHDKAKNCMGLISYYRENYTEALRWFQESAQQDNSHAKNNLGVLFENGLGVKQDFKKAVKWYRQASEQNNEKALIKH